MGTVKLKDFRSAVLASQTKALAKLRDIAMGKLHETYWHAYEQQLREAGRLLQVIDANPDADIASLSAPQPPAEAQAQGGGEVAATVVTKLGRGGEVGEPVVMLEPSYEAWLDTQPPSTSHKLYTAPPSAPDYPITAECRRCGVDYRCVPFPAKCAECGAGLPPSAPVGAAEDMVLDAIERRTPAAPVGVEELVSRAISQGKRLQWSAVMDTLERLRGTLALAQQPAAVDGAETTLARLQYVRDALARWTKMTGTRQASFLLWVDGWMYEVRAAQQGGES